MPANLHLNPPFDDPAADAAYFRAVNLYIIDAAVQAIEFITDPTTRDETPPEKRADILEKAGRSIRRSILLAQHVQRANQAQQTIRAREQIQRAVEDAIDATAKSPSRAETLRLELLERLEDPALESDILARPTPDITQDLKRDLGLPDQAGFFSHRRRTPADIAALRANATRCAIALREN